MSKWKVEPLSKSNPNGPLIVIRNEEGQQVLPWTWELTSREKDKELGGPYMICEAHNKDL